MADRQRLARPAEDHLPVRDEPGEPHGVDRRAPAAAAPPSPSPSPRARRASGRGGARRSRPAAAPSPPRPRSASSAPHRARSWVRRRRQLVHVFARAATRSWSKPVVLITTGTPARARADVLLDGRPRGRPRPRRRGATRRARARPSSRAGPSTEPTLPCRPRSNTFMPHAPDERRVDALDRRPEAGLDGPIPRRRAGRAGAARRRRRRRRRP